MMTDHCKEIIKFLNCEYELFEKEKNDERIINRFNELTAQGKQEGFFPLIVVSSDTLAETLELALEDTDLDNTPESITVLRESILSEAQAVDVREFLHERLAEYLEMHSDMDILGKFRKSEPDDCFYSHMDNKKPFPEILIAKIPAKNPWELAAWVPMGGFNDCPSAAEQVAVFRYWFEKYGAVPCAVTYDEWEMELQNPPTTDEAAEDLAKEHFAFCYDIVAQAGSGWDTIRARASTVKNSTTWYFWWD